MSKLEFGILPKIKIENIFGDEIAYLERYDFSRANMSNDNRIHAVSAVASICYHNPKALNSDKLFKRLEAEASGLPSSSFEFIPVLLPESEYWDRVHTRLELNHNDILTTNLPIVKFGEWIVHEGKSYLLTNYRAVIYTKELYPDIDLTNFYNTESECLIIAENFRVFKYYVDLPTRSQMVRHRISWQELSRRYVSGERLPFTFYISEKMKGILSTQSFSEDKSFSVDIVTKLSTNDVVEICNKHYHAALDAGVKPQEARRIIPQAAYTSIWGAFQPKQLENYMELRLDETSQWEIRQTAIAMKNSIVA